MAFGLSGDRVLFLVKRLRERLWVRPLAACLLSIGGAFVAKMADGTDLGRIVPSITAQSIETLLSVMASSMLVIATFAVASMVSAYASAGSVATPRSFTLVVSDDVSQNALSTFIGAFIFSIVALTVVQNDYYAEAGLFTLFLLTAFVFAAVILTFVRWVDRIARLGRLGTTIRKVEQAAARALERRRDAPTLGGARAENASPDGQAVYAASVGYVQHVDVAALQTFAEKVSGRVRVTALPGTLATPGRALAYVRRDSSDAEDEENEYGEVTDSFVVGDERRFEDDPRFGLVVLSEIASRALSPAVNDPGTAIDVVGRLVRLFVLWSTPAEAGERVDPKFDRVEVPEISVRDMFDDAFTAIGRDGAGTVEVSVRLQKALGSLATLDDSSIQDAAKHHARVALERARATMQNEEDLDAVRAASSRAR